MNRFLLILTAVAIPALQATAQDKYPTYDSLDKDGDGVLIEEEVIFNNELIKLLMDRGIVFDYADRNGDELVDQGEYELISVPGIIPDFDEIDDTGDGNLDEDEISNYRAVLEKMSFNFGVADRDGNGFIDRSEYTFYAYPVRHSPGQN